MNVQQILQNLGKLLSFRRENWMHPLVAENCKLHSLIFPSQRDFKFLLRKKKTGLYNEATSSADQSQILARRNTFH